MVIVAMVHSHGILLTYKGNLQFKDIKHHGDLFFDIILRDHVLIKFYKCDRILHYLYLSHIVEVVSIFIRNITVQVK